MRSIGLLVVIGVLTAACSSAHEDAGSAAADVTARTDHALAASLPDYCTGPEIVRIARPMSSSDATTFAYGFRYRAPADGAPTIVTLPGGPGQGSMDAGPTFVPAEWGYLAIDPRGVGCNQLAQVPTGDGAARFFRSEELAADVIAAIKDRGLTNYVLGGISYGTLLATTVANRLEAEHVTGPKAVVLEGVLGTTFGHDDANFAGMNYIAQFDRLRAALPADVRKELDESDKPFGLTPVQLTRGLMQLMPASIELTAQRLASLSHELEGVTDELRAESLALFQELGNSEQLSSPSEVSLYRYVACREIMDTVPASDLDVIFSKGHLVRNRAEEGTKCNELKVSAPYDSAKLPFSAPVFYFIGDSDVATPPWQGAYHFTNHTGGHATKIVTERGGHNSLRFNQSDCAPALMASIDKGGADLEAVSAACPLPVTIEKK